MKHSIKKTGKWTATSLEGKEKRGWEFIHDILYFDVDHTVFVLEFVWDAKKGWRVPKSGALIHCAKATLTWIPRSD